MKRELRMIEELVNNSPDGYSIAELADGLAIDISRRTLQRLLTELIEQGIIQREGKGRATRYCINQQVREPEKEYKIESPIPISSAAQQARNYIRQPLILRHPVSYQWQFLADYQPNQTRYLPPALTKELHHLGKQPGDYTQGGTFTKRILQRVLIDLSWNSSRLEGNSYSLLETQRLLEYGEKSSGKSSQEAKMILNHKAAIEFLVDNEELVSINKTTILHLHALLSYGLMADANAVGRLRKIPVGVGKTVYIPLEVPQSIENFFLSILEKGNAIEDPIEQAFFMLVHIPYLQAFEDVNKRTSRLAANIPLIKNNYCPLSFIDLPKKDYVDGLLAVYELNDVSLLADVFAWAYQHSIRRYSGVKEAMEYADPIRFRYRNEIAQVISHIVFKQLKPNTAVIFIQQWSQQNIKKFHQKHFIEIVETEIMCLSETNCICHKIPVDAFHAWEKQWRGRNSAKSS